MYTIISYWSMLFLFQKLTFPLQLTADVILRPKQESLAVGKKLHASIKKLKTQRSRAVNLIKNTSDTHYRLSLQTKLPRSDKNVWIKSCYNARVDRKMAHFLVSAVAKPKKRSSATRILSPKIFSLKKPFHVTNPGILCAMPT